MTTLKVASTRTITAAIKGKMEKVGQRGAYLDVQLLRLGMEYPETFKCWDPKQMEHVLLNQTATLILRCDGIKAQREDDGQINSYWWSISGVAETPIPRIEEPGPEYPAPPPAKDAIQTRIEIGMAFNAAYTLLAGRPVEEGDDRDLIADLRKLRDIIYHDVIQVPVATPHYCYLHEAPRILSPKSGNWGHILPDKTACVEWEVARRGNEQITFSKHTTEEVVP